MKMHQENNVFSPFAVVLENKRELEIFWDIMIRIRKCTDKNDKYENDGYEMAGKISDWLSNKVHL